MNALISHLKHIVAESFVLALKTKNYHWNAVSRHAFYSLHKLFEEQYLELDEAVDTLAERIRQLGSLAPATLDDYQKLSNLQEGDATLGADAMIKDLAGDQEKILVRLKEAIKAAQKYSDEGTADLLVERVRAHEKNKWMLESSLP